MLMATSSTDPNAAPLQHTFKLHDSVEPTEEADFIIIGYGNAGKAAAKSLQKTCPRARIMIVDPHSIPSRVLPDSEDHFGRNHAEPSHIIGSVVAFDHSKQTIDVFTSDHASSMKRLRYKTQIFIQKSQLFPKNVIQYPQVWSNPRISHPRISQSTSAN